VIRPRVVIHPLLDQLKARHTYSDEVLVI
jgi:hypothetical protein